MIRPGRETGFYFSMDFQKTQDGITEAFAEFAKREGLSFFR